FVEMMENSPELPRTSQPSPGAFFEVFERLAPRGPILCMTISEKLSGTIGAARIARDMLPDADIHLFDTLAATAGEGAEVIRAAQLLREGTELPDVLVDLAKYRENIKVYQGFLDLGNLVKGGRLSRIGGTLASILNIRVICHNVEGAIEVLEKVRGTERLFERIHELVLEQSRVVDMEERIVVITHADNPDRAEWLAERVRKLRPREVLVAPAGAVITTHAGRGTVLISV
ncbi:MAG: DegV family protein, partial [Clostridia bacterium]